jgi:hypothetical protein
VIQCRANVLVALAGIIVLLLAVGLGGCDKKEAAASRYDYTSGPLLRISVPAGLEVAENKVIPGQVMGKKDGGATFFIVNIADTASGNLTVSTNALAARGKSSQMSSHGINWKVVSIPPGAAMADYMAYATVDKSDVQILARGDWTESQFTDFVSAVEKR